MTKTSALTLIDAGTGNLRSVHKALLSLGAEVALTSRADAIPEAAKIVLPGVGAFGDFMQGLRDRGLVEPLLEFARRGRPLLGICVGMQAFFTLSEEMGRHPGLDLLPGRVVRFPENAALQDAPRLKVPHTGWNQLDFADGPMWSGLLPGAYAYFNHSYYCVPAETTDVSAWTDYGLRFAGAVHRENLFGVQFHPEKSQRVGLQVLANFLAL